MFNWFWTIFSLGAPDITVEKSLSASYLSVSIQRFPAVFDNINYKIRGD